MTTTEETKHQAYYRKFEERHTIYILKIQDKNIFKIGRTNKLYWRLKNIRVSLYENSDIYELIDCCCKQNALKKENFVKSQLEKYRLRGEWYEIPTTEEIDNVLNNIIQHIKLF